MHLQKVRECLLHKLISNVNVCLSSWVLLHRKDQRKILDSPSPHTVQMVSSNEAGIAPSTELSDKELNEKRSDLSPQPHTVHQQSGPDVQASGENNTQSGTEYPSSGWENPASGCELETIEDATQKDPREGIPEWKWKGSVFLLCLIGAVYGEYCSADFIMISD